MAIDFPDSPVAGEFFQSGSKTWLYDGQKWVIYNTIIVVDSNPIGSLQTYAGTSAPTGWLLAEGQAISRTSFADLFTVIGTTYGVGDGSTTFNLPDLRGRTAVGRDSSQSEFNTLGETGGAKTHTLTSGEMPSHTHTQNAHTHTQNAHSHSYYANINHGDGTPIFGEYLNVGLAYGSARRRYADGTENATATNQNTTATNQNTGGGGAHNNLQPYISLNYIIKYGPSAIINAQDDQIIIPVSVFS